MQRILPIAATSAVLMMLAGCVTSPITQLDEQGNYLVSIHTMYGLTTPRVLRERAAAKADDFCEQAGKKAHIKSSFGTGVTGLTNLSGNVVFDCVAP